MTRPKRRPARRSNLNQPAAMLTFEDELGDAEEIIVAKLSELWQKGWMPAELLNHFNRLDLGDLLAIVPVAIMQERRKHPAAAEPAWLRSLDEVSAQALAPTLGQLAARLEVEPDRLATDAATFSAVLSLLPRLTVLCPPPGSLARSTGRNASTSQVTEKVLSRIRALLAKAEATSFVEEAEAFTAKAQQLMSEYSIERARLDDPEGTAPAAIRIWHDAPYTSQKATLLGQIAAANGCRSVWNSGLRVSTVFGFEHDLAAVELLHTSLLVQANSEMMSAVKGVDFEPGRVRSFRSSFLIGFGYRIGERLAQVRKHSAERAAGDGGDDLLPVLASREARVEDAMTAEFPNLTSRSISLSNGDGYLAGTVAANKADIGPGGSRLREAG